MSKKSKYGLSIFCLLLIILIAFSFAFGNAQENSVTVKTISGDEKELDNLNLVNSDIVNGLSSAKNGGKNIKSRSYLISSKNSEKLNLNKDKDGNAYLSSKTKKYTPINNEYYNTLGNSYIENNKQGNPVINIYDRDFKSIEQNYNYDHFKFELKKGSELYNLVKTDDATTVYNLDHNNKKYCIIVIDNETEFRNKQEKDGSDNMDISKKKYKYEAKIFVLEMNFKDQSYKDISHVSVSDDFTEVPSIGYVSAFDKIVMSVENNYKGKYLLFDTENKTVSTQNIEALPKSDSDNRPITVLSIVEGNFPYFDKKENKLNIIHSDIKNGNIIIFKYILENNQLKFSEKVDTKIPMINDTYAISKDNKVRKTNINEPKKNNLPKEPYMISITSEMPYYYLLLNHKDSNKVVFFKTVNIDIYKNMFYNSTENTSYGYHNLGSNPAIEINIYDKIKNKVVYQGLIDGPVRSNPSDFILCNVEDLNK
ncbi:MAG: hypothetical protein RR561_04000 [Peptostreptococcus sp.]|uniref:hypothetical protein n=1 Tax=Peptostreptococcus sp. TaxID=1262 RepID=UPI002FCB370E